MKFWLEPVSLLRLSITQLKHTLAAAWHRSGREEIPYIHGQEWLPRGDSPSRRSGAVAKRRYPKSKVMRSSWEDLPQIQGREQRPRGDTPSLRSGTAAKWRYPKSSSRSGAVVMRIYPTSKVRSNGCTLLEQPWRDTPCPR